MTPLSHQGGSQAGPSQPSPPSPPTNGSPPRREDEGARWPNTNDPFRFYVDPYQTTKATLEEMIPSTFFTSSLHDPTHFLLDPFLPVTPHIVDHLRQYGKPILSTEWAFACLTYKETQPEARYTLLGFREEQEKQAEQIARLDGKKKNIVASLINHLEFPSSDPSAAPGRTIARAPRDQLRQFRLEDLPVQLPPPPSNKRSNTPTVEPEVTGRRSAREKGKARATPAEQEAHATEEQSGSRTPPSPTSSGLATASVPRFLKVLPAKRGRPPRNPPPNARHPPPPPPPPPSASLPPTSLSTLAVIEAEGPPQGIPPGPRPTTKPTVTYASLIGQAILAHPERKLSLNAIYEWISTAYPFFQRGQAGWMNSIRHNLSLNPNFVKKRRDENETTIGKGAMWSIEPGSEALFEGGKYRKAGSSARKKEAAARAARAEAKAAPKGSRSSARHSTGGAGTSLDGQDPSPSTSGLGGIDMDVDTNGTRESGERSPPPDGSRVESDDEDEEMAHAMQLEQEAEDAHIARLQREPSLTFSSPVFADEKPLPGLNEDGAEDGVGSAGQASSPSGSPEKRRRLE